MLLLDWCSLRYEPLGFLLGCQSIDLPWDRKSNPTTPGKDCRIGCFNDLPDEILLMILGYLLPVDVLRAFHSTDTSERFHRLIRDYRTKIHLSKLRYADFHYLIDHISSESGIVELSLSNSGIPCLTEHFLSFCRDLPFDELLELELDGCASINPSLIAWISKRRKLESFSFNTFIPQESLPTLAQRSLLRDFIFTGQISTSLHTLRATVYPGLVLSNQLLSRTIAQLCYVELDLDTFDDLCILLNKNFLPNVQELTVTVDRRGPGANRPMPPFPLHHRLRDFALMEVRGGLKLNELASVFRAMPALKQLYLHIRNSDDVSFARPSLVEAILPASLDEFYYTAYFLFPLPENIRCDKTSDQPARFPMKISNQLVYTVPSKWGFLGFTAPVCDYKPEYQRAITRISMYQDTVINEENMAILKPWHGVLTIKSQGTLPPLEGFRRLQRLDTSDGSVVHTTMPPTLRSLKLTDETPLALGAPISTLVHAQIHRLTMARPICDELDLLNLLRQFPNLRYLSIVLPEFQSDLCLAHILKNDPARLPHLICLQAHGGASTLWQEAPIEWPISSTDLKFSSTPFHAAYNENDGLVVWL